MKQSPFPMIILKFDNEKIIYFFMNDNAKKILNLNIGYVYSENGKKNLFLFKRINGDLVNILIES
jgi:hypothetical protein